MENPRIIPKTLDIQKTHDSNTKTYLISLLPLILLLLPLSSSQPWSPSKMRPILFVSSPFYTLIFPLITNRSSISQQLHFNFCYFYFGILPSLLMTFMSHFDQLQLYPSSSTTFRVQSIFHFTYNFQNITMALGAHMRPYSYMYCTHPLGTGRYIYHVTTCILNAIIQFTI